MIDSKYSHIVNDGMDITIARTVPYTGKATISRFKSTTDYTSANRRLMNLLLESNLATGEIVTTADESFLCVVSRKEVVAGQEISIVAHGLMCNATLSVIQFVETYDDDGNVTGSTPTTVIDAIPCRADKVNSRMRQEDPGLLSTTTMKVYAKHNSALKQLDKATIVEKNYQVDEIDLLEVPGGMVLQLSEWTGG